MGQSPVPLNERGRAAVGMLAEALDGEGIGVIYTSTVVRASESSEILAGRWGCGIEEEPRLNESRYEGWVGMTYSELSGDPEFEMYRSSPTRSKFSKGEGMAGLQRRALGAIERIVSDGSCDRAAAVSHSDVIKPVIAHFLGMELDDIHRLSVDNASVTLLEIHADRRPRLRYMNMAPWRARAGGL